MVIRFAVLKMGFAEYNETTALFTDHNPDIVCSSRLCKSPRWNGQPPNDLNLENPPIKDTVVLPARGYVVIRFRSTNPGYWNMHCHATTHHMEGMNILFREASEKIGPVPVGFPTCRKFAWFQQQFDDYLAKSKLLITSTYQDDNQNPGGEVRFQPDDDETEVVKSCKQLEGKCYGSFTLHGSGNGNGTGTGNGKNGFLYIMLYCSHCSGTGTRSGTGKCYNGLRTHFSVPDLYPGGAL